MSAPRAADLANRTRAVPMSDDFVIDVLRGGQTLVAVMSRGRARGLDAVVLVVCAIVAACAPSPSPPDDGPLDPPFAVSDHFAPTGYMGDGATPGLVTMTTDACTSRAPDASPDVMGDCYAIHYTPSILWAGV